MSSKVLEWLNDSNGSIKNETEEIVPRKSYSKKVVGWLDILGIREKIKNEKEYDAEAIIEIMANLSAYVKTACDEYEAKDVMHYLQIADGFMIAAEMDYAQKLCEIICEIQWKILVYLKMLSRGAITAGNVSVENDGKIIIGPAYVDAYAMESENAVFARTIISDQLVKELEISSMPYIKLDSDNVYYLDYIDYIMHSQQFDSKRISQILVQNNVIKELKTYYDQLDNKLSVRQKYGWTLSLLDRNNIQYKKHNSGGNAK